MTGHLGLGGGVFYCDQRGDTCILGLFWPYFSPFLSPKLKIAFHQILLIGLLEECKISAFV